MPDLAGLPFGDYPFDVRWRLRRDDVLVYTSEPLATPIEITGHLFIVRYASSDCPDTDWHVALHDVAPDGKSEDLATGCRRAMARGGLESALTPIPTGEVLEYHVELLATSNLWLAGHRLRVTIASAMWPGAARNPNTGAAMGDDDEVRIAQNAVHHAPQHPSHLLAPVVQTAAGDDSATT